MAGGTFLTQNKVRPGVYVNFKSISDALGTVSDRGVAALPLVLSWGAEGTVIETNVNSNFYELFGYDLFDSSLFDKLSDTELFYARECLKNCKTLYIYKVNTGTKATATLGNLVATAKYGGTRGNDITVAIQANIDDAAKFDLITYVDSIEQDRQEFLATVADVVNNAWVTFSGNGVLDVTAGTPLVGGANGTVTSSNYSDFITAIEAYNFNTTGYCGTDSSIKALFEAFIKRVRDDEGKKAQVVLESYPSSDYEGVISVKNGVVLEDGSTLAAKDAVAWVIGATAGANVNKSLTYSKYNGAVNVNPRYTHSEIVTALSNGEFVFTKNSNDDVVVEQDINTLVTFTAEKGREFRKNRVMRVLDSLGNDVKKIYETYYLGKVSNNADGRNLLKNEIISYINTLQDINAVQNFDAQTDIEVLEGNTSDSVVINMNVQPVDAVEKIYITVKVA